MILQRLSAAAIAVILTGCQSATEVNSKATIPLYTSANFNTVINGPAQSLPFSGKPLQLSGGKINVTTAGDNSVSLRFKDAWFTAVEVTGNASFLTMREDGVLSLDIQTDNMKQAGLEVQVGCSQSPCINSFRLREWALEQSGDGWRNLKIPLYCIIRDPGQADQSHPFTLSTGGTGQVAIRNVAFIGNEQSSLSCPTALSTTPAILNEYWSESWWMTRHHEKKAQVAAHQADIVLIGDSITHGWEDKGSDIWEQYYGRIPTVNLGFSGDRTENVLWRLEHGELAGQQAELTLIMIGTNNTGHRMDSPEDIAAGVAAIVGKVKAAMPTTHIVLQAIFPRGEDNEDFQRKNNQQTNALLETMASQSGITFININQAFLQDNGELSREVMPDLLHPNQAGYEIWAQQLAPYISRYVSEDKQQRK